LGSYRIGTTSPAAPLDTGWAIGAPSLLRRIRRGFILKAHEHDPLKAKLVELRYFAGLTGDQAAAVLGISPSSADRHWVYTRAWLRRELGLGPES
jgi:hypothetical protein